MNRCSVSDHYIYTKVYKPIFVINVIINRSSILHHDEYELMYIIMVHKEDITHLSYKSVIAH